mgnify:CR=1 FL=1
MESLRILVFNWRCWLDPAMGGLRFSLVRLLSVGLGPGMRSHHLLLGFQHRGHEIADGKDSFLRRYVVHKL